MNIKKIKLNSTTYDVHDARINTIGNGLSNISGTLDVSASGVTAGSYGPTENVTGDDGNTIKVPEITVNSYGQVTGVTERVYTSKNTTYSLGDAAYKGVATSIGVTGSNAYLATEKAVRDAINALPEPMIFKGSLGTGGTITSLPTASSSNTGFTYKVITAGEYASQSAEIGDTFISDGSSWVLIPSGDEPSGTVTSIATGNGLTGGPITSSGTIALSAATASALGGIKVGSGLSVANDGTLSANSLTDNNFTTTYKNKLDGIATGAEVNVLANWNETNTSSDAYIQNKPSSLPASDVYSWAKASSKPSYSWDEINSKPNVAIQGEPNNLVSSGNEINIVPSGYSGSVWINYRTCGGLNGNITDYILGNGAGVALGNIIHTGNIGSQSVNYATSAGNADTLDGYHYGNLPYLSTSGGTVSGNVTGTRLWLNYDSNLSPDCSWTNSALTVPSIEIQNYIGLDTSTNPTLAFHWYGNGGPLLRADNNNDLWIESAGDNTARTATNSNTYFRALQLTCRDSNGIYINGNGIIHAGNIGSQSVNYASSAGNADTLDGYHYNNLPYLPLSGGTMTGTITSSDVYPSLKVIHSGNLKLLLGYYTIGGYTYLSNEANSAEIRIHDDGRLLYAKYSGESTFDYAIIHSGNIGNQSVNYATSAGSAPASDVYSWAKASSKPSYSWSEITDKPSVITSDNIGQQDVNYATYAGTATYANAAGSVAWGDIFNKPAIPVCTNVEMVGRAKIKSTNYTLGVTTNIWFIVHIENPHVLDYDSHYDISIAAFYVGQYDTQQYHNCVSGRYVCHFNPWYVSDRTNATKYMVKETTNQASDVKIGYYTWSGSDRGSVGNEYGSPGVYIPFCIRNFSSTVYDVVVEATVSGIDANVTVARYSGEISDYIWNEDEDVAEYYNYD